MPPPRLASLLVAAAAMAAAPASAAPTFADEAAQTVASVMTLSDGMGTFQGWRQLDGLAGIRWDPLPPQDNEAAPSGHIYFRGGSTSIGGRPVKVFARGARSMVFMVEMMSSTAPASAVPPIRQSLAARGLSVKPVLCRRSQTPRLSETRFEISRGAGKTPAVLHQAHACGSDGCREALVLYLDTEIQPLSPQRQAQFTDSCQ